MLRKRMHVHAHSLLREPGLFFMLHDQIRARESLIRAPWTRSWQMTGKDWNVLLAELTCFIFSALLFAASNS